MSKYTTGTVTKQTTGALQFMVAFAGGGGGCYTYVNISHFVVAWDAGGASPTQHASDVYYNFINKSRDYKVCRAGLSYLGALGGEDRCYSAFELLLGT